MFSIIDNEIKVNFEILGGTSTGTGGAGAVIPASVTSMAITMAKNMAMRDFPAVLNIFRNKFPDAYAKLDDLEDDDWKDYYKTSTDKSKYLDLSVYTYSKNNIPTGPPQFGGNLNDALSKDIQLVLIGGSSPFVNAFYASFIEWIFKSTRDKVKEVKKQMHKSSSKEALADYTDLSLTGENVGFEEITRRINNKLEVKDSNGEYKSLDDYWSGKREQYLANKSNYGVGINCFHTYEPIFDKDGSVKNQTCLDYIKDKNNWKVGVEDIKKVHPVVAFNLLKSLGFQGIRSTSNGLTKVQSYSSWYNDLHKDSKKALQNSSGKIDNDQLIKNIIAFVNANPSILNMGDIPESAGPDKYGVMPALFNESFDRERKLVQDKMTLVRARLFGLTGDRIFELAQSGGGYQFPSRNFNKIENFPIFSKQLRTIYTNLQSRLKSYQKTLGDVTKEKIERIFSNLEKHENEAKELIRRLEYYYIDVKANNNKVNEILTDEALDTAKKNLNKNLNKIAGRSTSLLDIEQVINSAVMDAKSFSLPSEIQ